MCNFYDTNFLYFLLSLLLCCFASYCDAVLLATVICLVLIARHYLQAYSANNFFLCVSPFNSGTTVQLSRNVQLFYSHMAIPC